MIRRLIISLLIVGCGTEPENDCDDGYIELWGLCCSEDITELDLSDSGLIGSIPYNLGNFPNLKSIYLNGNHISGTVPEIICGIDNIYLDDNNLCPPYPECLSEEDIGYQNTSNCP